MIAALTAAGVPVERLQTVQPASAHYHPGRSAKLVLGKAVLAEFGELHPGLAGDLAHVAAAEIHIDSLPERRAKRARPAYQPAALQPVRRDFAFLVADSVPADQLLRAIRNSEKDLLTDVSLFDRFTGPGVPEGHASLAVTVTLQPRDATLTDADLERISKAIVAAAAKAGGTLRA